MRRITATVFAAGLLFAFTGCGGTMKEIQKTRKMQVAGVELSKIPDGTYQGSYSYAGSDFVVDVTVRDHTIEKIDIVEAFTGTRPSREAQAIIDTVVAYQSIEVDVITGATTTSKAYLKAVENALRKGLVE